MDPRSVRRQFYLIRRPYASNLREKTGSRNSVGSLGILRESIGLLQEIEVSQKTSQGSRSMADRPFDLET